MSLGINTINSLGVVKFTGFIVHSVSLLYKFLIKILRTVEFHLHTLLISTVFA